MTQGSVGGCQRRRLERWERNLKGGRIEAETQMTWGVVLGVA